MTARYAARLDGIDYRGTIGSCRVFAGDPKVVVPAAGGGTAEAPAYGYFAGLIASVADKVGWWVSPSNREIRGVLGTSGCVSPGLGDRDAEANKLNERHLATIVRANGYRLRGNRTCSSEPRWQYLSVVRTAGRINEDVVESHLRAVERNITRTYVPDVVKGVNAYPRSLFAEAAIPAGRCRADPDLNQKSQVQGGEL